MEALDDSDIEFLGEDSPPEGSPPLYDDEEELNECEVKEILDMVKQFK